jgi:ATP-dependent RNA helicase RhlE
VEPAEAFLALGLTRLAAQGAAHAGFTRPTEVQEKVVPVVTAGRDVIACSETGSGKTASFALPILDLLDYEAPFIQAVVLVPTRELCRQVAEEFRRLGAGFPLHVAEIYGGMSYTGQRQAISMRPQVVVGAPGRVLDLLGSRTLDFSRLRILVLDEGDRMLDMGFLPQMREIFRYVPEKRQTLMFSATIPVEVSRFAKFCLTDPVNILVGERAKPPSQVVQEAVEVGLGEKEAKLVEIVAAEPGTILVFSATKSRADLLYHALKRAGQNVCVIHADRSQPDRKKAIDGFRSGRYRIMVATDVAQRGLDIEGISLVINYDLPNNPEDYVHRIGRTGRANAPGRAVSLVTCREYSDLKAIERLTGHTFKNLGPSSRSLDRRSSLKRRTRGRSIF